VNLLFGLLLVLVAGYAALCGVLYAKQRALLYLPSPEPLDAGRLSALADFELVETVTGDGLTLRHLWLPPRDPGAGVVVSFHGNGGNAGGRAEKMLRALPAGQGLLLVEYRGYAGNPGRPSEAGLLSDADSALRWLEARGIDHPRWRLYGESLGSGVATQLAAAEAAAGRPVAGVALEAPFTSIAAAAQHHYWYVPALWLMRDRFDSLARIDGIGAPLLIVHGRLDRVVPYAMGERLLAAARPPKRLLAVERGQHADLYEFPEVTALVSRFLARPEAVAAE
jgi:fermentation-respiration switch protein FrsA (DUF1100 family)